MKGMHPIFFNPEGTGSTGSGANGGLTNGTDYNTACSKSVDKVDLVQTLVEKHSLPIFGPPNSVMRNYRKGSLSTERYFDVNGNPYLDIDYSDHGNPSTHKIVPHEHDIKIDKNGNMKRGRGEEIKK